MTEIGALLYLRKDDKLGGVKDRWAMTKAGIGVFVIEETRPEPA